MKILPIVLALLLPVSMAAQSPPKGIWLTAQEIGSLPMEGKAWEALKATATGSWATPTLSNQDSAANVQVWAGALYAVRTGSQTMREKVRAAVKKIPSTIGGRTLALGRELPAYVLAIDLVGWSTQAEEDSFKSFLRSARTKELDGKTLISTFEQKPNNWASQAAFALVVVDRYLADADGLARRVKVFRGLLGDRSSYAGYTYDQDNWEEWQADPKLPVPINPRGATKEGHSIDGALPEEMRRGPNSGVFDWPPPCVNYCWTSYTPLLSAAWVLSRSGHQDVFSWSDSALLRAIRWLHVEADCPAEGNDVGTSWLANSIWGTTFRVSSPTQISREIGWLDWTHARSWSEPPPPDPEPDPEDFMTNFNFGFLETSRTWSVNVNPPNGYQPGTGTTPGKALADWLTKNPTF